MRAETWAASVHAEAAWLARLRTMRWPKGREAGSYLVQRPVVFDASARLMRGNNEKRLTLVDRAWCLGPGGRSVKQAR